MAARSHLSRPGLITGLFDLIGLCHCKVRLEILLAVWRQPDDVCSLAGRLSLDPSHVSKYLHDFERAGVVEHQRVGHRHIFRTGVNIRLTPKAGSLLLEFGADTRAEVHLVIPPEDLAELLEPGPPEIVIRTVDALAQQSRNRAG